MNKLVETLIFEKTNKINSGIYGMTQREFAYNSNKIEGSKLSKQHTSSLFNTGSVYSQNQSFRAKDIEETTGHFAMFNKMLDTLSVKLCTEMILEFHRYLKQGVFEDIANGYAVGQYKTMKNFVGNIETCKPEDVMQEMIKLLTWYEKTKKQSGIDLRTIALFHVQYEKIHPFQDGNGRTGRIIIYRECLVNNIIPFIIRDVNKAKYIYCLEEAQLNNNVKPLVDYFIEEQKWYSDKINGAIIS